MQSTPEDVRETEAIEHEKSQPRKLKLLMMTSGIVLELLKPADKIAKQRRYVQFEGMPEDAELVNVTWDCESQAFAIVVRSETFDEVPFGKVLPALTVTCSITCT